ncbi:MAG: hypothetical protein C0481_02385 [Phenylobacterium sp.]|uniref:methionyl-tRNA formyltransferase n=1 Tax=Phenylobacterium sp. TaxID=1871053 RepID=UPI0025E3F3A0|nr:formyltransferase family protein [Phenylobacterium sp.]MBA4010692.1 hypothetical protein [Phenylobacterium sp.]
MLVACVVGLKGAVFLERLLTAGVRPVKVVTYEQRDDASRSWERIKEIAASAGVETLFDRRPDVSGAELIYVVGWQYLMEDTGPHVVVFHDSLLPRYRGFAPTVAALINGDDEIGVTALQPRSDVDSGPVFGQASIEVRHPMAIAAALEAQASLMADLAVDLHARWREGRLSATPQDERQASYSIWRDEQDYRIDWSQSAQALERFVYAVGTPYGGARARAGDREIIIDRASAVEDLPFVARHSGKIWSLNDGAPLVICGEGMLRLDACRTPNGEPFAFSRVRVRLS